jgi:MOSC domain-containing protein YiiM
MAHVVAVCVVHALRADDGKGVTAIDKRPVEGKVKVTPYGLLGDVQADRKNHGGLEQAIYVYGQSDADFWAKQLGRDLPPGWFGENLLVEGMDVNAARVGEIWRIGDKVTLEVTSPRGPCQTFARWVGGDDERGWVKRFAAERRLGPYLRVLETGSVEAGDEVTVVSVPEGAPLAISLYHDE